MAEYDPRPRVDDPRNAGVQGGHGDDGTRFSRGGHAPAGDADEWLDHAGRASDRASTEYRGATHEQDRVDVPGAPRRAERPERRPGAGQAGTRRPARRGQPRRPSGREALNRRSS